MHPNRESYFQKINQTEDTDQQLNLNPTQEVNSQLPTEHCPDNKNSLGKVESCSNQEGDYPNDQNLQK